MTIFALFLYEVKLIETDVHQVLCQLLTNDYTPSRYRFYHGSINVITSYANDFARMILLLIDG